MGKVFEYQKIVIGAQLHEELKAAGFLVETVFSKFNYDNPATSKRYCKVVLDGKETKDPTSIVEAHIPQPEIIPPSSDLATEIDELKLRVKKLEKK